MNQTKLPISVVLRVVLALSIFNPLGAQTTIYSEGFEGNELTDLNGTMPGTTTDNSVWVASPNFKKDGSFGGSAGSATLAFSPVDGLIYTLDASVTVTGVNANWLAFGFVNGQSTTSGTTNRFVNGSETLGRVWMLVRGDNSDFSNASHTETTNDPAVWNGAIANADGGDIELRIVLNTTGGAGGWSATWFAKRPVDASYTEVRSETILPNEGIDSVGFAIGNVDVFGEIKSFSLTSNAEPAVEAPKIISISRNGNGDIVLTLDRPAEGLQAESSNDLDGFDDVASTSDGNTLTILAANVDPNEDGADYFRVSE